MQRAMLQPALYATKGQVMSHFSLLGSAVCSNMRNYALGVGVHYGSGHYEPTFGHEPFLNIASGKCIETSVLSFWYKCGLDVSQ